MNATKTIRDNCLGHFYIEMDGLNYTVCSDTDAGYKTIHGFYSTLPGALLKIAKLLADDNYDSIQLYIDKLNEIKETMINSEAWTGI